MTNTFTFQPFVSEIFVENYFSTWKNIFVYKDESGVGDCNPFQYSFLENSIDRGTWQAIVHERKSEKTEHTQIHKNETIFRNLLP